MTSPDQPELFRCKSCGATARSVNAISKGFVPTGYGGMIHSCDPGGRGDVETLNMRDAMQRAEVYCSACGAIATDRHRCHGWNIERGLRAVLDEILRHGEYEDAIEALPRLVEIFQKAASNGHNS